MDGVTFKKELKKSHPQFGVFPCDLCPSQLPKRGDVIGCVMKRRLEFMHQKDANVRQVELKSIIREVAEEVVGIWQKASVPCWGVDYTEKHLKKLWDTKLKIGKSRKDLSDETAKSMNALFDISHCRLAPKLQEDIAFLRDQQRQRKLHIGRSLDRQTMERWQRQQQRRLRTEREGSAAAAAAARHSAAATVVPRSDRRTASLCRQSAGRSAAVLGSFTSGSRGGAAGSERLRGRRDK